MDPLSVISYLSEARRHAKALLDAVRGAKHKKSVWYSFCKELGDNCATILPLLESVENELNKRAHSSATTDGVEDALSTLDAAIQEGTQLVVKCQDASTLRLFFRGAGLREEFCEVSDRIARCLRALPLAVLGSTLATEQNVRDICHKLEHARFELSEADHALLQATHDVVGQQSERTEERHNTVVSLLQQFEQRLNMKVADMRTEMRANTGDDAVDLDAKEQKFMSQIAMLLQITSEHSPIGG